METDETNRLIQGTMEWLEMRKHCVTSTDSVVILGCDPYGGTPRKLYDRKKGLVAAPSPNAAMQRGSAYEEEARQAYEQLADVQVFPAVKFHKEHDWLMSSLDGITMEGDRVVEIKTCGKDTFDRCQNSDIPLHFQVQCQHHMLVTGLPRCDLFLYLIDSTQSLLCRIEADPAIHNSILRHGKEFYDCLQNDTPPPCTDKDYQRVLVDGNLTTINAWIEINKGLKQLEKSEKQLRDTIISLGDDGNCILGLEDGRDLVTMTRVQPAGNVDWKRLCKDHGIDDATVDLYRKDSIGYYRLSAVKEKE